MPHGHDCECQYPFAVMCSTKATTGLLTMTPCTSSRKRFKRPSKTQIPLGSETTERTVCLLGLILVVKVKLVNGRCTIVLITMYNHVINYIEDTKVSVPFIKPNAENAY